MTVVKQRFLAYATLLCASAISVISAGPSFKPEQFKAEYGNNTFRWEKKLKFEGFYSKNARLLNNGNGDLGKVLIPGKFTLDSSMFHDYYNPECDRYTVRSKAGLRFKGTFGAPESSFRSGPSTIKDLEAVIGSHSHPINVHIPVLRELWLDFSLNDLLGLSFDHDHHFKVGLFPFSLGRGIALGDAFAVVPDFIGYDPASSIEQYAPGFLFSGTLIDKHTLDYDAYAAILDNLSDSFGAVNLKTQGQMYGNRFSQARGYGVINYVLAGRLKWTPVNDECHKVYFEPYAMFNDERDQKLEFSGDATSKLGTFGLAMETRSGDWEFGFDVAHNIGKQYVKGLDRNIVTKELRNGVPTFVNSHVTAIADDAGNNDLAGKKAVYRPASSSTPNNQNAINLPIERATQCDKLVSNNGQVLLDVSGATTNLRNATDRFRDPYSNDFSGFMAVADMSWKLQQDLKFATTVGYASGDENPNKDLNELGESQIDGDYKGFISLQELYSGKRVRSAFLLSGKGKVPRVLSFPVNNSESDVNPPKNLFPDSVSRFTNIAFVGAALWWNVETCTRKWSINPNVLTFWQTHASKIPSTLEPTNDSCDKPSIPRDCARTHLGTELNVYIVGDMFPGLQAFVTSGVFIAGSHFDDIKGRPLNNAQKKFLDSVDQTGVTTDNTPVLGNDNAFFLNAGFEYRF